MNQEKERQKRTIFLDRDGVINEDRHFIRSREDIAFIEGSLEALRMIHEQGDLAIVVTNQSGIARGFFTESDLLSMHAYMDTIIEQNNGKISKYYFASYHPDFDCSHLLSPYNDPQWRKPNAGMFEVASKDFDCDLNNAWLIGDSERDIIAGKEVGCKTIGVRTGKGCPVQSCEPDYTVDNLLAAVTLIYKNDCGE